MKDDAERNEVRARLKREQRNDVFIEAGIVFCILGL